MPFCIITSRRALHCPVPDIRELLQIWCIRNCRAIFTALVFPGYLAKPISSEASMPMARTYFLENIAKDEERRYSVYSSVTACPELLATSFAEINGKNT